MPTSKVLIAFGSNVGDSDAAYERVQLELPKHGLEMLAASTSIRTEPIGGEAEGKESSYLNDAFLAQTRLTPNQTIMELLGIEKQLGRVRDRRWGPRTVDLDLLLFDQRITSEPGLICPHPRMTYRRFVLEPAAEIGADLVHPVSGCTLRQLLDQLNSRHQLVLWIGPWCESLSSLEPISTPLGHTVQRVEPLYYRDTISEFEHVFAICKIESVDEFESLANLARLVVISEGPHLDRRLVDRARRFAGGMLRLEGSMDARREVVSAIDAMS